MYVKPGLIIKKYTVVLIPLFLGRIFSQISRLLFFLSAPLFIFLLRLEIRLDQLFWQRFDFLLSLIDLNKNRIYFV